MMIKTTFSNSLLFVVLVVVSTSDHQQGRALALNVVQLGDSYSAGNGAGSYNEDTCFTSRANWGRTLAILLGAKNYNNQACSGTGVGDVAGQATAIDDSTDLVLLGVGANDLLFKEVILTCFSPIPPPYGDGDATACARLIFLTIPVTLAWYGSQLLEALLDMFQKLNDQAIVVLVAYPHITQNTAYTETCCGFSGSNWSIINGLRDLALTVDSVQRNAVEAANSEVGREFVYFYDGTKPLFEGHEPHPNFYVLNPDRWIVEWYEPHDYVEEVYHPNPKGHSELGNALAPFVRNKLPDTPNPTATPTASPTVTPTHRPTTTPTATPTAPPTSAPTPAPVPDSTPPPTLRATVSPTALPLSPTATPTPKPTYFIESSYPTRTPTNPSDSGSGGSSSICFSEDAMVQVERHAAPVPMKDLRLGDRVLVNKSQQKQVPVYEPIYAFAHRHETQPATFLQIFTNFNEAGTSSSDTNDDLPIEMSGEHMVYVWGKRGPVRADSIQLGDALIHVSAAAAAAAAALVESHDGAVFTALAIVTRISKVERKGLYAPLTASGKIVVNGILASTYVGVQEKANDYVELSSGSNGKQLQLLIHQADVLHLSLSPLRMACLGISSKFCQSSTLILNDDEGMHPYVAMGLKLVMWGERQPIWVQGSVLFVVLLVTGAIRVVELVFGPLHGALLLLVAGMAVLKIFTKKKDKKQHHYEELGVKKLV